MGQSRTGRIASGCLVLMLLLSGGIGDNSVFLCMCKEFFFLILENLILNEIA